jgi:nucleotide-binding universal stress UspA family protein
VFHSILVAVDGSPHAQRALEQAVDLARSTGASLTVMTSVPDLPSWLLAGPIDPSTMETLLGENDREHEALLREAVANVPESMKATSILGRGAPGRAIVEQVSNGAHDLVVMGSRGRGDVKAMVLGSVSHFVLQQSDAAVLVVHAVHDDS